MTRYPEVPIELKAIFQHSVSAHYAVLRLSFAYIIFIVVIKNLYVYLGGMPHNWIAKTIIMLLMTLSLIYFWAGSLMSGNSVLQDEFFNLRFICKRLNKRLGPIYLCCLTYVALVTGFYYLAKLAILLIEYYRPDWQLVEPLGMLIFAGLPIFFLLLLSFFTLPLVILEGMPVGAAFRQAIRLVWKHWERSFVAYVVLVVILILVSPESLHWHFMEAYYLTGLFDLVALSVMLPLFNNIVLFSLHDLRLRYKLSMEDE